MAGATGLTLTQSADLPPRYRDPSALIRFPRNKGPALVGLAKLECAGDGSVVRLGRARS
jgi:hypothetical protein